MHSSETVIGSEIRHTPSTPSTMDDVARLARQGWPEGLVLWADAQTAGRGRHQRSWESEDGEDLLFSVLFRLRPAIAGEINMLLTLAVSELVDDACGTTAQVKWPNDVRVDGAKIAGILLESSQDVDGLAVVAGTGLNVNSRMKGVTPGGTPAVSMRDLAGREFDRKDLLEWLIWRVDGLYNAVRAGGTVVPEWRERLESIGQQVRVTFVASSGHERSISGLAEDVDESGRLIVRDETGRAWPVAAGEVTLR